MKEHAPLVVLLHTSERTAYILPTLVVCFAFDFSYLKVTVNQSQRDQLQRGSRILLNEINVSHF